jgi:hypothetical protein
VENDCRGGLHAVLNHHHPAPEPITSPSRSAPPYYSMAASGNHHWSESETGGGGEAI